MPKLARAGRGSAGRSGLRNRARVRTIGQVMAARVRIFSTKYCGYCMMAKRLLNARKIPFDEVDVTCDPEARAEVSLATGHRTVPIIFIDDRFIGGSDELHDLDAAGGLAGLGA